MIVDILEIILYVVVVFMFYTLGVRKGFKKGAEYVIKEFKRHR